MTLDPSLTGVGGNLSGGATGLGAMFQLLQGQNISGGMKSMFGPDDRPLQTAQQQPYDGQGPLVQLPRGLPYNPYSSTTSADMGYPSLGSLGGATSPNSPERIYANTGFGSINSGSTGGNGGNAGGQSMSLGNLSVNFNPAGGASFAKGGQVHGLKAIAQDLQDMGRGGDTMLAHINPQEAALLKRMGGSGTINPATGLPEFLKIKALKSVEKPFRSDGAIGKLAAPIIDPIRGIIQDLGPVATIAAGLYSPWAAGIVGGLSGQKGFDFKRALLSGAMAYGAQNLAQGLSASSDAALTAAADTAAPAVTDVAASLGTDVATGAGSQAAMLAEQAAGFGDAGLANIASSGAYGAGSAANLVGAAADTTAGMVDAYNAGNQSMFDKGIQSVSDLGSKVGTQIKDVGSGIYNLASGDPRAMEAFKASGVTLGNTAAPMFLGYSGIAAIDEQEKFLKEQLEKGDIANDEFNRQMALIEGSRRRSEEAVRRNPYMFAKGGEVPRYGLGGIMKALDPAKGILQKAQVAIPSVPAPEEARSVGIAENVISKASPEQLSAYLGELRKASGSDKGAYLALLNNPMNFAYGGSVDDTAGMDDLSPTGMAQGSLGNLSQGLRFAEGGQPRFLSGGGDGMSDDIPATIGGKQPARLADGEFVIPADVVSHLGNGSSKAGAKQLYSMMDKVRTARTGTKKQGKQIKPAKFMPA